MSFCGLAALHVAGLFPSPRAYATPVLVLFVAGAPLSVPATIVVAPFVAAAVVGEPPTPGYFALAATYAMAFVLIVRLTKALDSRAGQPSILLP